MIQHFRATFLLIILNVIAFGVLFIASNSQYNSFQKKDSLNSNIIEYTNNLESLSISSSQLDEEIKLNKEGSSWILKEPIAWHGPIVMNTREELQTAINELRNDHFSKS